MTWDQISGPLDRVLLVALTYFASKGWITPGEVAGYATLVLGLLGAIYGWWVNRPKAIVQSAAALPGTIVVTTAALAAATPDESNIVSNVDTKVVPK